MNYKLTPPWASMALLLNLLFATFSVSGQACPIPTLTATWTNESTSSLGFTSGTVFSSTVDVVGTFTIDVTTFTLSGANLGMRQNAEIIVQPMCTLIIDNSTLAARQFAWTGIRVEPGGRVETNDATICEAITAIRSNAAFGPTPGSLDIRNSDFFHNQTGIRLQNYTATAYPAFVAGNEFLGGPISGASTVFSSRGVVASNVGVPTGFGLNLGDLSAGGLPNHFENLDVGVEGISSALGVFNATFAEMQDINGFNEGYGILCNAPSPGPYMLDVGAIGVGSITMTGCRYGVASRNYDEVFIVGTTYGAGTGPTEIGFQVRQASNLISISQNTVSDFSDVGILLDENPGFGGGFIDGLVELTTITGTGALSEGIVIDEFDGDLWVRDNTVLDVHRGITLQTVASNPQVDNNTISFGYAGLSTSPAIGIAMLNVTSGDVIDNTIVGNCPFAGGFGPCTTSTIPNRRIRGIQLSETEDVWVESNDINFCGGGLYVESANVAGNAVCNDFTDCFVGTVFDAMPAGGFGIPSGINFYVAASLVGGHDNANNTWQSSVTGFLPFRATSINGADAFQTTWWHDASPVIRDMPIGTITNPGGTILSNSVGIPNNYCFDNTPLTEQDTMPSSLFWMPVMDSLLAMAEPLNLQRPFYNYLKAVANRENPAQKESSVLALTSIPALLQSQDHWLAGDINSLDAALNSVNPVNESEAIWAKLFQVRVEAQGQFLQDTAKTFASRWQDNLSEDNAKWLYRLATADVSEWGHTVYWAQSFLDTTIIHDRWQEEEGFSERIAMSQEPDLFAFPNPASKQVYMSLPDVEGLLQVFDHTGVSVWSGLTSSAYYTIDVSSWANGLYIIDWQGNNGKRKNQTLLIQHSR